MPSFDAKPAALHEVPQSSGITLVLQSTEQPAHANADMNANASVAADLKKSLDAKDADDVVVEDSASDSDAGRRMVAVGPAVQTTTTQFVLILVGLALAVFLAALDQTIVAVAIPAIAKDFQSLTQIAWIGTAFFLTSTALIPSFGKLADIFGRKPVFLTAIVIFEIGSIMCGASTTMNMLIASRAIAGIGGGGIFSLAIIIISDLVSLKDRAMYQGLIGACFGIASVAGPLLGGLFTDTLSWRWCFYINGPIGAFTIIVAVFLLDLPASTDNWRTSIQRVDFTGTLLLVGAVIAFLIPVQGGGTQYAWNSPTVISLFIVAGILTAAFIYVELKFATEPIIPFELFLNYRSVAVFVAAFFLGMSFFPIVFYAPVYFQVSFGQTATQAGISTLPLILGLVVFSINAGVVASKTGRYMPLVVVGGILIAVGAGLMSTLSATTPGGLRILFLLITGMGIGTSFQSIVIAAQASVSEKYLAIITSLSNFWQTIGAVIGLAVTSSIFNNKLTRPTLTLPPLAADPTLIRDIRFVPTDALRDSVIDAYVQSLCVIFLCVVPFASCMVLASLFIKTDKLSEEMREAPAMAA
ncbi:major facilitator superfamily domain-containing protein [Entophlyctis helioformis]|nr:major facilitator superfamily domain-containing protein [Entophlyctis helioformis]